MRQFIYLSILLFLNFTCQSQIENTNTKLVGGPCEGCEAIFDYRDQVLNSVDTLPFFATTEPKLKLTGTVYHKDGKTPAENVILYIYQTDRKGLYESQENATGWGRRHGHLRGWVKTGEDGKYTFYTFRPAAYPNGREAEHIHITVKEPDKNEYYIDDYVFDNDPLLTMEKRNALKNRGGSGIIEPKVENGILTAHRDLILGFNIPDYE